MTHPTEPRVEMKANDSMCGGLYPVHGSVTHVRAVECCDFCGLPADYEPTRTAAEAANREEVERLREALAQIANNNWRDQSRAKAVARAALSPAATGEGDEEGPCTDCGDTGWKFQTERRCDCGAPASEAYDG